MFFQSRPPKLRIWPRRPFGPAVFHWSVTVVLLSLLGLVHHELWFTDGGHVHVVSLRQQLHKVQVVNAQLKERNDAMDAEIADLRDGMEILEESARYRLGMLRPDEILVQFLNVKNPEGAASDPAGR